MNRINSNHINDLNYPMSSGIKRLTTKQRRIKMKKGIVIPLVLFIAVFVFAGGFQLSVESGSNRNEALIIKPFGCHTPSDAKLNGTAEGIVNGEENL